MYHPRVRQIERVPAQRGGLDVRPGVELRLRFLNVGDCYRGRSGKQDPDEDTYGLKLTLGSFTGEEMAIATLVTNRISTFPL